MKDQFLLEAQDPNTSKERLEELYQNSDERRKKVLAQNPNTPVPLLIQLANDGYANLVVQNLVWEILYFENPNFLNEYPQEKLQFVKTFTFLTEKFFFFIQNHPDTEVVCWLAENPNCTPPKLKKLATHPSPKVRAAVANHKRTPRDIVQQLAYDPEKSVRAEAVKHLPEENLRLLYRLGMNPETLEFERKRQDPNFSQEELLSLIELGPFVAYLAGQHPNAPPLETFIEHPEPLLRAGAAASSASVQVLEVLSKDPNKLVRVAVAENPKCPEEILQELLPDVSVSVRAAIARNTRSESMLSVLAQDTDETVAATVASRADISESLLETLSKHASGKVRDAVSKNLKATPDILAHLLYDHWRGTRHHIAHHPNRPKKTLQSFWNLGLSQDLSEYNERWINPHTTSEELGELSKKCAWVTSLIASHPNCSGAFADQLVQNADHRIRSAIATNPKLSQANLLQLASDPHKEVLIALASNPSAPFSTLINAPNVGVQIAVACNPLCPPELLEFLCKKPRNSGPQDIIPHLIKNPNCPAELLYKVSPLCEGVVENPNVPEEILRNCFQQGKWLVAIAKNPSTPTEILRALFQDKNFRRDFRAWITHNPKCPVDILEELALDYDEGTRKQVARHPNTPQEILVRLSKDPDRLVRMEAFSHPNISREALANFSGDESFGVCFGVANHASCPDEVRLRLIQTKGFLEQIPDVLRNASRSLVVALPDEGNEFLQYLKRLASDLPYT